MGVSPCLQGGCRPSGLGLSEASEDSTYDSHLPLATLPTSGMSFQRLIVPKAPAPQGRDRTGEASKNPISPGEKNQCRRGHENKAK